ncbi:MAG: FAD binding domain-containing protein [Deltaproteobacteria bacterium]|nr:FAD binding domain-containing protein [Deltaproteobacteria bacterium]
MSWNACEKPESLPEALTVLEKAAGRGRLIAGGTDLVLQLKRGEKQVDTLVDITGIQGLNKIEEEADWIRIGALVTHAEVAKSLLIRNEANALAEGCSQVGSPQIRNAGTLVGNIINAQPAADAAIALLALDAEINVLSKTTERWMPLESAYRGIGLSTVDATREIVTEIRFKKLGRNGVTGFFRMARRKALILPSVNGAVAIRFGASLRRVEKARIVIGPVANKPYRARGAEAVLESGEISPESIAEAARVASEEADPRTSLLRGGSAYRKEMVGLYLTRTIQGLLDETKKQEQDR